MAFNGKKISFGFSKTSKQILPLKLTTNVKEKIQFVDCLDSKVIVCKKDEDVKKKETVDLVIPLNRTGDQSNKNVSVREKNEGAGKDDKRTDTAETENTKEQTLEEIAVKEILDGAKETSDVKEEQKSSYLQILSSRHRNETSLESTLDDYENVPITNFGMAMLRGMGWEPDKSITKNEGVFSPETPQVRPRGMGLGADKVAPTALQKAISSEEEELKIVKGAYVQVTFGSFRGHYGQIEGFMNEDDGRIIIKLAMQSSTVSLYEYAVKLVTKSEYDKNSRVLNVSKYEEYKQKSERQSERMQQRGDKNSADNMSDSERRGDRTDKSSQEEHDIKRTKHKTNRSSEDKSDDSERRRHKTKKYSEDGNDSERKRHRTGRSSEETSDDSARRRHKTKKYFEDRIDSERKRHRTSWSSEETSDDSARRRQKTKKYSEGSSDSERKRHRTSMSEETSDDSSRRQHRLDRSSLDRISEEKSDDSDTKGHRKNRSSEDRSDDSSKRRHSKNRNPEEKRRHK